MLRFCLQNILIRRTDETISSARLCEHRTLHQKEKKKQTCLNIRGLKADLHSAWLMMSAGFFPPKGLYLTTLRRVGVSPWKSAPAHTARRCIRRENRTKSRANNGNRLHIAALASCTFLTPSCPVELTALCWQHVHQRPVGVQDTRMPGHVLRAGRLPHRHLRR